MTPPDTKARVVAAVVWLFLAAATAVLVLGRSRPYAIVFVGAALALLAPERDDPGWDGFIPAALTRIADTLLFAAVAWSLGRHDGDTAGAAAAAALLSASLISSYVRIRATSLAIDGGKAAAWLSGFERAIRLVLLGVSLAADLVSLVWAAAAFSLGLAAIRSSAVWRHASRG